MKVFQRSKYFLLIDGNLWRYVRYLTLQDEKKKTILLKISTFCPTADGVDGNANESKVKREKKKQMFSFYIEIEGIAIIFIVDTQISM